MVAVRESEDYMLLAWKNPTMVGPMWVVYYHYTGEVGILKVQHAKMANLASLRMPQAQMAAPAFGQMPELIHSQQHPSACEDQFFFLRYCRNPLLLRTKL